MTRTRPTVARLASLRRRARSPAHVTLENKEAVAGTSFKLVLRVPHGCGGAGDDAHPRPHPGRVHVREAAAKAGWTIEVVKGRASSIRRPGMVTRRRRRRSPGPGASRRASTTSSRSSSPRRRRRSRPRSTFRSCRNAALPSSAGSKFRLPARQPAGPQVAGAVVQAQRADVTQRLRRLVAGLAALVCVLLSFGAADRAEAHASFLASQPAAGLVTAEPPASVVLRFNEAVVLTSARLTTPSGERFDLPLSAAAAAEHALALPRQAEEGTYSLSWRVVSDDGHPGRRRLHLLGRAGVGGAPPRRPRRPSRCAPCSGSRVSSPSAARPSASAAPLP